MSVFFIAEAGVNHNGNMDIARALIDVAAQTGADAVKFQTFKADSTVAKGTKTVAYQAKTTNEDNQYDLLKRLELTEDDHHQLIQHAKDKHIEFMSTAFDLSCAQFLYDVGVQRIKVPSGEITNLPFIKHLAQYDLPIILSTGMATQDEIAEAVEVITTTRACLDFDRPFDDMLSILHCTSAYPTPSEQLNLAAITTLKTAFGCPVGYSDHSHDLLAGPMAVALGATIYEKHFTLDRTMVGPDHSASLEPEELREMIANIRQAETMVGDGIKVPQPCEIEASVLVRRALFASKDLPAGHQVTADDVVILRPAQGLLPRYFDTLIGTTLIREMKAGGAFEMNDIAS